MPEEMKMVQIPASLVKQAKAAGVNDIPAHIAAILLRDLLERNANRAGISQAPDPVTATR